MSKFKTEIARTLGSLGGNQTLRTHGKKHFKEMAKKKWENWKILHSGTKLT
jgi:hypothetical protein